MLPAPAVARVVLLSVSFAWRAARKNQRRSRNTGPPIVSSNVLLSLSTRESATVGAFPVVPVPLLYGSLAVHLSLVKVVRNDPENRLLPDFVIGLTTPPAKRPYSAEMLPVWTVVSWIASSMKS